MKLFRKPKSKFYWYDFTVRGRRYRGSTQETKPAWASKAASLKLASIIENTDPLPCKPPVLGDFAGRFLAWVNNSRLEEKTRKFYRNGWRLRWRLHSRLRDTASTIKNELLSLVHLLRFRMDQAAGVA